MDKRSKAFSECDATPIERSLEKSGHVSGAMLKASLIAPRDIIDALPEDVLKWLHEENDDENALSSREPIGHFSDFESVIVDRLFPLRDTRPFVRRLHSHSLATATAAVSLAAKLGESAKTAWVCGWLHDLGIAACLRHADEVTRVDDDDAFLSLWPSIERSSAQHAIRLASRWRLPSAVRHSIREHECFVTLGAPSTMVAIICVAEYIATLNGFDFLSEHANTLAVGRALESLRIDDREIAAAATRTKQILRHHPVPACLAPRMTSGARP